MRRDLDHAFQFCWVEMRRADKRPYLSQCRGQAFRQGTRTRGGLDAGGMADEERIIK